MPPDMRDMYKLHPCNPMDGEPYFTILARDPLFAEFVNLWAKRRMQAVRCGDRPVEDREQAVTAQRIASAGEEWRRKNNGAWRVPAGPLPDGVTA